MTPKVIKLKSAILNAAEGAVIYARPPFNAESKAMLVELDVAGYPPEGFKKNAADRGFREFLDADTVNEVLDSAHEVQITRDQLIEVILHFAEHAEYPTWFHDLDVKE